MQSGSRAEANGLLPRRSEAALQAALWAHDFAWVISVYLGMGEGGDVGAQLFILAQECLARSCFAEARIIVGFLQENLTVESSFGAVLSSLRLHLDTLVLQTSEDGPGLTVSGIGEYLASFADSLDVAGLLVAQDGFCKLIVGEQVAILKRYADNLVALIAAQPIVVAEQRRQFQVNLVSLEKLHPLAAARLAGVEPADLAGEIFHWRGQVFVRGDGGWHVHMADAARQQEDEKFFRECTCEAPVISCQGVERLLDLMACFYKDSPCFNRRLCYLIVDFDELARVLALMDVGRLLDCDYAFRFIDHARIATDFAAVMRKHNCLFPDLFSHIGGGGAGVQMEVQGTLAALEQELEFALKGHVTANTGYYDAEFLSALPDKIARRNLRILLLTSRFTVFVQYAIRDLAEALTALGCTCMVLKEDEQEGTGVRRDIFAEQIRRFKPDLIFCANHNRLTNVPENLPWINWVQDGLEETFGTAGVLGCGRNSFLGYVHPHWRERLLQVGYPVEKFFYFPLGTNSMRFRPGGAHKVHGVKRSEISYVANCSSTPEAEFAKFKGSFSGEFHPLFEEMFFRVASSFAEDHPLWGWDDYARILRELGKKSGHCFPEEEFREIVDHFWHLIGSRFYRQQPLLWLSEAGYDLALYGHGWEKHPQLAKHARGFVAHGDALSEIYCNSAINLSIHEMGNYTARIFDGPASGGFFLSRYHAADFRPGGLMDYLDPDRDAIYFSNRLELLEKVDYYLEHREEREQLAAALRKKVLAKYDYKIIMNNVLDFLQGQIATGG